MKNFEYASPATKEAAVGLLTGDAVVLAGGTDLLSLMKDDLVAPSRVVNIKNIRELRGIEFDDTEGLRLGALVTLAELIGDQTVRENYPALVQAAEGVRGPQILNVGTVGGDLCQRPRCWYFRNGFGLMAMKDGESMAKAGDNRYHAILGNDGPACFVNPSSLAPGLIALGAKVRIFGQNGPREVLLEELFRIPKSETEKELSLNDGEIVTDILVPPAGGKRSATYEVRQRKTLDWPLATASVAIEVTGETIQSAEVVLGHVAPIPWVCPSAADALVGKPLNEQAAEDAGKAAALKATPLSQNRYKVRLTHTAVKRAVLLAGGMEV
jgi:xanthine dehydrogenase YagS FAD-binding subunit